MKASDRKRLQALREQVCRANKSLVDLGLVVSTFGNVSGIDRGIGLIAIKPSGVGYDELTPSNMVVLDLEGNKVEGDLNPSSDTKTHVRLYQAFTEVGGIVHTHSRNATAWAQARRPLPCIGTTHADYFHGTIPCTAVITDEQIARGYEAETATQIIDAFARIDYREMPGVLVASHGPFSWGKDAEEAVHHGHMLEYVAGMAAVSFQLNPRLGPVRKSLGDKHWLRKHGENAYYGQKRG